MTTLRFSEANFRRKDIMKDKIIINVGRQFGSGGKLVALELGRKLGINVYDNELITKAAESSGFSPELFKIKDEKRNLFPVSSFFATPFGNPKNFINGENLFQIQSSVIRDIAEKESAVIVGRCADYILRDMDCKIDVFITAPVEDRIRRVMERMDLTREKAGDLIAKTDRKRETYYNYYTFGNWGMASNYDLCIDSSLLGIAETADYIIDFARRRGILHKEGE